MERTLWQTLLPFALDAIGLNITPPIEPFCEPSFSRRLLAQIRISPRALTARPPEAGIYKIAAQQQNSPRFIKASMRVYNLTGALFALSNLALNRLKISRYHDLNDPFELMGVNLADKRHRKLFREAREQIDKTQGIICFSESWKNPLLWGHYAEKHTGIALGFEIPEKLLLRVRYREKLAAVQLDARTGQPTKEFIDKLALTKFKDWQYENERRLVVPFEERGFRIRMYFMPFSRDLQLREVVLGPKCKLPIGRIRELVSNYKPRITVIQSRIAFTRFEVLTHKAASAADKNAFH